MRPIALTVQGFGPHQDTRLDMQQLSGLVGLTGPTGTGKTTLIGAFFAAIYGTFPDYPGTLWDALTVGGDGKGLLVATFHHNGERWQSERQLRGTQRAFLRRHDGDDWEVIAGPKVKDVDAEVATQFGTAALALSTWFCTREATHDMIRCLPSERRAIFGQLLGFEALNRSSALAGDAARTAETEAGVLAAQLRDLPDYAAEITAKLLAIDTRQDELNSLRIAHARQSEDLATVRAALQHTGADDETLRQQVAAYNAAAAGLTRVQQGLSDAAAQRVRLTERARPYDDAVAATQRLAAAKQHRATLENQAVAHRRRRDWQQQVDRYEREIVQSRGFLATLEGTPGADPETVACAATLDAVKREFEKIARDNCDIRRRNDERGRMLQQMTNRREVLLSDIAGLERRLGKRQPTPYGDDCAPCHFLRDFAAIPAQIESHRKDLASIAVQLAAMPEEEPLLDEAAVRERAIVAQEAVRQVKAAEKVRRDAEECRRQIASKEQHLAELQRLEPAQVEDPHAELTPLNAEIERLQVLAAKLESAKQALVDLEELKVREAALEAELEAARLSFLRSCFAGRFA